MLCSGQTAVETCQVKVQNAANWANGLNDAGGAIKTLKSVLGSKHALVGASCLFVASAFEKRVVCSWHRLLRNELRLT